MAVWTFTIFFTTFPWEFVSESAIIPRMMCMQGRPEPAGVDAIRSRILTVRGVQVMLDRDLAELYGVPAKVLNQAVKRNIERFPAEFMFALQVGEMTELVTDCDRFKRMKHSSVPMRAFTEYGIIMLASVLKSNIATNLEEQPCRR